VISQALGSYEAALILETSTDTRIIATDAINANAAATAPIDRNVLLSIKNPSEPSDDAFAPKEATSYKQSEDVKPQPNRGNETCPKGTK
jgi:hypothetical protein